MLFESCRAIFFHVLSGWCDSLGWFCWYRARRVGVGVELLDAGAGAVSVSLLVTPTNTPATDEVVLLLCCFAL